MKKITILSAGSRGDIQPCLVLGKALSREGYDVRLAAPENFAGFVQEHGVYFYSIRGDVQQVMASDTGREFMEKGSRNPIQSIRVMRNLMAPIVTEMLEDAYAACRDADILICLAVLASFGGSIAEALKIPLILIEPTPSFPTAAFPAPGWPIQRNLGGLHNRLSGSFMLQVIWHWYRPYVNDFRRQLDLTAYSFSSFYRLLAAKPLLGAYSPSVIPTPDDWPASARVTGYLYLDDGAGWQPPDRLQAFLDAGDPPVYIGFGSMAGRNPDQLAALVLEALVESGQRGLLLSGWGGLRAMSVPDSVFIIDSAPHGWLFPRMSAVVHHGGAGTTSEGLRAGVPTVVVPFIVDQTFWGARVKALGLGPVPIPRKKLTANRLAAAIDIAVTHPGMKEAAGLVSKAINNEDGIGDAVAVINQVLG